jgi:hypothetical protein
MTDNTMSTALAFARHGHAVFPIWWPVAGPDGRSRCACGKTDCSAAKHPHGRTAPNGPRSATTDTGIIKHWFYILPDANLGVATDKLVVVDVDPRHDGDASLAALEREHGEFPLTWRVLTGGGGEHIIFACPDGVTVGNVSAKTTKNPPLGAGIDIRAALGYIVAPPSRHISGKAYTWSVDHHPQDVRLAFAPDWLIKRLQTRGGVGVGDGIGPPVAPLGSDEWSQLTQQPITEYRDLAATKVVGHMLRHSCEWQYIRGMMHAWNSAMCHPPLGYYELERIIDHIAGLEAKRIRAQLARRS